MNTTNTRIKKLRKALDLTQAEFAERIGVKRNTVATYEMGRSQPIDSAVALICREFHVNETWLRTGEGEMFQRRPRDGELADFFRDVLQDEDEDFRKRFISLLARLDTSDWEALERMAEKLVRKKDRETTAASEQARMAEEARAEADRYYEQLLSEKRQALQASSVKESGAG